MYIFCSSQVILNKSDGKLFKGRQQHSFNGSRVVTLDVLHRGSEGVT